MQLRCCLFARKQRLLFESPALFEGVNIIRMGVNIVRMHNTKLELLTRTKRALTQSREKWSDKTAERMKILFQEEPKLKDVTGINKYSEIGNVSAVKMESVIQ